MVAGNHDLDLVRPAVGQRLRWHLGVAASDDRVRIWPWLYVVPGVLYAEHGNQHHDLNRFPRILDPYSRRRPGEMHTPPLAAAHASARRPGVQLDPSPAGVPRRRPDDVARRTGGRRPGVPGEARGRTRCRSDSKASSSRTLERRPRLRPIRTARRLGSVLTRRLLGAGQRSARRLSRRRRRRRARDLRTLGVALSRSTCSVTRMSPPTVASATARPATSTAARGPRTSGTATPRPTTPRRSRSWRSWPTALA